MPRIKTYTVVLILMVLVAGCRELYDPASVTGKSNFLVVDGMIAAGNNQSVITLSRSTGWHDTIDVIYVRNARVELEGEDGSIYSFSESGNGQYSVDSLGLDSSKHYRLNIRLAEGKSYSSDFVPVLNSPPIDSVSWSQNVDPEDPNLHDLNLFVSTHDDLNKTRYYFWKYDETWKYHSPIISKLIYKPGGFVMATKEEQERLYYCWQSSKSNSILIGNTDLLSHDAISMQPLTHITGNSIKKSFIYSINVKQYALTPGAYNYYDLIRKNSEQSGSFFDPQPSTLVGNIRNVKDGSELVLGYLNISTPSSKRIYINENFFYHYPTNCEVSMLHSLRYSDIQYPDINYPVDYLLDHLTLVQTGFLIAPSKCVNCELLGGHNGRPVFWPDSL
ncbi:MAG: DUF4249 domain-containing protein [Bacteroidetes bacterium]|nr:DUF4249 domain-containing protein [Bacteroidota bacterium]